MDQLIYTHRVVLEMLFRPDSSHNVCDEYESEEQNTSSTTTLGTTRAHAVGVGGSAGGSTAPHGSQAATGATGTHRCAAGGAGSRRRLRGPAGRWPEPCQDQA